MKKSLFAILAVAACFASCSEVLESTALENPISFDNYVGKDAMTRASVVQGVESVRVNAFLRYKGDATGKANFQANFMNNQEVYKIKSGEKAGQWDYAPSKFWPAADQVVDFVSWVPVPDYTVEVKDADGKTTSTEKRNNINVQNATLTFTVPEEVKHQSDLLVAEAQMGLNRVADNTDNAPVNLKFQHLLSRIGFEIIATGIPTDGVTVVDLVEVTLKGNFASKGEVDMTKDNKTTGEGAAAVTNTLAIVTASDNVTTTQYKLTGTHFGWEDNKMTNATTAEGSTTLVGRTNASDSYIMLIPDGNDPEKITVTYTITTKNAEGSDTVVTNTADFELQQEGQAKFQYQAGKAYKYIFKITMQSITFSVQEDDWDEEIVTDITPKDPNAKA